MISLIDSRNVVRLWLQGGIERFHYTGVSLAYKYGVFNNMHAWRDIHRVQWSMVVMQACGKRGAGYDLFCRCGG
jgi:hypothetical protein